MKLLHLRGRKPNAYIRKEGRVWRGKTMTIRWLRGVPKHSNVDLRLEAIYAGTLASTKLNKSAVKRNRMRRRCREALRRYCKTTTKLPTMQMMISPRAASLLCDFSEIEADVEKFFGGLQR